MEYELLTKLSELEGKNADYLIEIETHHQKSKLDKYSLYNVLMALKIKDVFIFERFIRKYKLGDRLNEAVELEKLINLE